MFETSQSQKTWRGRLLFIELLPVSLGLHAAIAVAIVIATVWKVNFPTNSPKHYLAFQLSDTPPPPPPPPPPPAARPQQVTRTEPVQVPTEDVAPTVIPDVIPTVVEIPPAPVDNGVAGGVEGGVEGGEVGGVLGGEIGGVITDTAPPPPPPPPPADGRVHVSRDDELPMEVVKQDYPRYPSAAVKNGLEDRVIVRYVIGKDGRVKSVTVLDKPIHEMFVAPTVNAIKEWRFKPMVVDGKRQEVVHELTVNFRLHRGARGG